MSVTYRCTGRTNRIMWNATGLTRPRPKRNGFRSTRRESNGAAVCIVCRMLLPVILLSTVAAFGVLLRRGGRMKLDATGWFIIAAGVAYLLPTLAAKFSGSLTYAPGLDGELVVVSLGWADRLTAASAFVVLAAAGALVFLNTRRRVISFSPPGIALVALTVTGMVGFAIRTQQLPSGQPFLLIFSLLAVSMASTSFRSVASACVALTFGVAGLSALLLAVSPSTASTACSYKCTWAGDILSGVTSHGNALALALTLGLPMVWLLYGGWARLILVAYLILMISVSGSRTSLAVAFVLVLMLGAINPSLEGTAVRARAPWLGLVGALVAASVALVVPIVAQGDDSFATGRGYLWRLALEYEREHPITGMGTMSWGTLYQEGKIGAAATYATHNQWFEALFMGGAVGVFMFGLAIVLFLSVGGRSTKIAVAPLLATVMALGVLERPIGIDLVTSTSWALFALVALTRCENGTPASHAPARIGQANPVQNLQSKTKRNARG